MQIYLLRHGIAEDARPGQADADRALTPEGRDKLRRVLKRARAADVLPALILSSPLKRALETAKIAAETLKYDGEIVRTRALEPEAPPEHAWDEIRARRDVSAILLAGHEPHMSNMLAFLLDCPSLQVEFKKGALARVDCDRFAGHPKCVLKWLITPGISDEP
jgi:phosphohistidine phosphatase